MFFRALRRTLSFALAYPGRFVGANLVYFGALFPAALLVEASLQVGLLQPWVALPIAVWWIWMSSTWLVESFRRRLQGEDGWFDWTLTWFVDCGLRHTLNLVLVVIGLLWVRWNLTAWDFLLAGKTFVKVMLSAVTCSVGLWFLLAGLMSMAQASGKGAGLLRRLKLYALTPLAFFPACLATLVFVLVPFALLLLIDDPMAVKSRFIALPIILVPVLTASLDATLIASLAGEIRCVALGQEGENASLPSFRDLLRPWDS